MTLHRSRVFMAIALICVGTTAHAFGLGENFGRGIALRAVAIGLGYLPILIALTMMFRALTRGQNRKALLVFGVSLLIFVGFPLLDRARYMQTRDTVMSALILPASLDLRGKNILYLGDCHRVCAALGAHGAQANLYSGHVTSGERLAAYEALNAQSDLKAFRLIEIVPNPEKYQGIEKTWLDEGVTRPIDYIILDGFRGAITPALLSWYKDKPPKKALVNRLIMAPVDDQTRFDLKQTTTDLFIPHHRGRYFTVPFNPLVSTYKRSTMVPATYADLARMLCGHAGADAINECERAL